MLRVMKFSLKDVDMSLYLGVSNEERFSKQTVKVSVRFSYDTEKAAQSDDLKDTIDYFDLYQLIKNFPKDREYKLLERLYEDLEQTILEAYPAIDSLRLKIEKIPF